jgi:hypothetical protein
MSFSRFEFVLVVQEILFYICNGFLFEVLHLSFFGILLFIDDRHLMGESFVFLPDLIQPKLELNFPHSYDFLCLLLFLDDDTLHVFA